MGPSFIAGNCGTPAGCMRPTSYTDRGCGACVSRHMCSVRQPGGGDPPFIVRDVYSGPDAKRAAASPPAPPQSAARAAALPGSQAGGSQQTVVLIDCSPSMASDDYPPTRLAAAAAAGRKFVVTRSQLSRSDQAAVVSFCGRARTLCGFQPLPAMKREVIAVMEGIEIDSATSIGAGLNEAEKLLSNGITSWLDRLLGLAAVPPSARGGCRKRVILLTDGGQNTRPDPGPVAERLKQAGVLIDCIGIGARHEVDEDLLRRIASVENGQVRYRFISDPQDLLDHYRRLGGDLTR